MRKELPTFWPPDFGIVETLPQKFMIGSSLAALLDGKESETENYSTSGKIAKMTRRLLYPLLFRGSLDSFQVRFPLMVRRAFFFPIYTPRFPN